MREARFELLSVLQQLGDSEAARAESALFEERKRRDRTASMSKSARGRGDAYLEQGDPEAALREYRQAIRLNPSDAAPHYGVSLALARLGADPAERIEALDKAVALDPDFAQAHNDLGILHMEGGRFIEAERVLRAAVAVNPQFAEAHNNLGVLYAKLGRNSEAERLFRRAAEDDPGYASAYVNHGLTLAALDRWEPAERSLRKAEELLPDDLKVLAGLGMLFMRTNRAEEALTRLHRIAELNPRSAQAHLNVGGALTAKLDLEGALASFTRAAALAPDSSQVRYHRGRCLYDLGRNEEAKAELQRAIALAPDSTEPLYLLALVEKRLGNGPAAADRLRKVIEAAPGNAAGHFQLGLVTLDLEGDGAAVPHWRNALKADPEHAEALFNLSEAPRSNDPEQAAAYRSRFEAWRSRRQINSRAGLSRHFSLASAAARDWDRAVAQLTEALKECGECPEQFELHKHLGLIYARSGRPNEGERELRRAARLKARGHGGRAGATAAGAGFAGSRKGSGLSRPNLHLDHAHLGRTRRPRGVKVRGRRFFEVVQRFVFGRPLAGNFMITADFGLALLTESPNSPTLHQVSSKCSLLPAKVYGIMRKCRLTDSPTISRAVP